MMEVIPLLLFLCICLVLMCGFPVAFSLAGTSLLFAAIGTLTGTFDTSLLTAVPNRLYGTITNANLFAVPMFIFMGMMLEKSRIAESLLEGMAMLFGKMRGGLGISVILVGMLLAASTGIVGATVVTMGVLSLPTMVRAGYSPALATGTICATGTLGQIIPPSIALVLLGDVMSNAYQQAQLRMGIFSTQTVSVGDLFAGAMVPGLLLVLFYVIYMLAVAYLKPEAAPSARAEDLGADTATHRRSARFDTFRRRDANGSRRSRSAWFNPAGPCQTAPGPGNLQGCLHFHRESQFHGLPDPDWRVHFLTGIQRIWR